MITGPEVSVVLTTFRGASRGYLCEAIESVLAQTFDSLELIIVDDGSTDRTREICEAYLEKPKVRYVFQENRGLAGARNTGVESAKGSYVCFLDDDDYWHPHKVERQVRFLSGSSEVVAMVYTSLVEVDETSSRVGERRCAPPDTPTVSLFFRNWVTAPSSVMLKRDAMQRLGPFSEALKSSEDYEYWLRLSKLYEIRALDEPLTFYRVHSDQMTRNHKRMEFYCQMALFLALEEPPPGVEEDKVYHQLFLRYARDRLSRDDYVGFRKRLVMSHAYRRLEPVWYMRYLLSYWPSFLRFLQRIKWRLGLRS